ncbi:hypothetical protein GCM10023094_21020 [Rhodococcus olei]|uniref:Uncharacterized protein n=1 Tax=Rhodococcus olei TaxID=2161675 RepID=A0ABP8NYI5_9NOCA
MYMMPIVLWSVVVRSRTIHDPFGALAGTGRDASIAGAVRGARSTMAHALTTVADGCRESGLSVLTHGPE